MDSLSSTLSLPALGIALVVDESVATHGTIVFEYANDDLDVSSVNLAELSINFRCSAYAASLYGIFGPFYIDDTVLTAGFFPGEAENLEFAIMEGLTKIYRRQITVGQACREVGALSLWIHNVVNGNTAPMIDIAHPPIQININLLPRIRAG
jgi:hypothetical protein